MRMRIPALGWSGRMAGVALALASAGCSQPGDTHLAELRKAQERVELGLETLGTWEPDSVAAARSRVAERFKDLDWLTADTALSFAVKDGQRIGDWTRVKRFLKDGPERLSALVHEGEVCLTQLEGLESAIRAGATEDANGTPMDEAYFQREAARELGLVGQWEAAVAETERLLSSGLELEESTRAPLDSLIRAKRAEWARRIAQEE
jgi:hypothetical protein